MVLFVFIWCVLNRGRSFQDLYQSVSWTFLILLNSISWGCWGGFIKCFKTMLWTLKTYSLRHMRWSLHLLAFHHCHQIPRSLGYGKLEEEWVSENTTNPFQFSCVEQHSKTIPVSHRIEGLYSSSVQRLNSYIETQLQLYYQNAFALGSWKNANGFFPAEHCVSHNLSSFLFLVWLFHHLQLLS